MPYKGSLKVNGCELSELDLSTWRKAISWIGQNPMLLHGSIRDNVTLGKQDIQDQQVHSVLNDSHAAEFVEMHGLDYQISDRSGGLSVGQAQRLANLRVRCYKTGVFGYSMSQPPAWMLGARNL